MQRRRGGLVLILLGLVLAIGAAALFYFLIQNNASLVQNPPTQPTEVPTQKLPVAARPLTSGTLVTETDITLEDFPLNLSTDGLIVDTGELLDRQLISDVSEGALIRTDQVRGGTGPISAQINDGKVLFAFPIVDLINQSRVVREGDRIDLLLTINIKEETLTEEREGKATNYTVQNIPVLRIVTTTPDENGNSEPQALLLELSPQDAAIVKWVKDSEGTIDFTLRGPDDTTEFNTSAVTQDYLFDNYGFFAPRSATRPKQQ